MLDTCDGAGTDFNCAAAASGGKCFQNDASTYAYCSVNGTLIG
nr:hypothetical protein [Nannocystis sp.]